MNQEHVAVRISASAAGRMRGREHIRLPRDLHSRVRTQAPELVEKTMREAQALVGAELRRLTFED